MFWNRRRREEDLDRELRSHLELETEEQGGDRNAARRILGNDAMLRESTRAMWTGAWLEQLLRDFAYGVRALRHHPGFAAVAILSLALGIGANTAIFSVMDALVLRMLPVRAPEELFIVSTTSRSFLGNLSFSYPRYSELRDKSQSLSGLVAFHTRTIGFTGAAGTDRITGAIVSSNYFSVLGVPAELGSLFGPEETRDPVVVLSHGFWSRRFGGDPDVLGRKLLLNGYPFTVIGVAARRFTGTEVGHSVDAFVPTARVAALMPNNPKALDQRRNVWLRLIARLKPGVTVEQANSELSVHLHRFNLVDAPTITDERRRAGLLAEGVQLLPGSTGLSGLRRQLEPIMRLLTGVVLVVLLIACSNVATLLLARAAGRQREIAIRAAIGAGRGRLVAQLLTESLVLAVSGAALGLVFAKWVRDLILAFLPQGMELEAALDLRVLAFTVALVVATTMLFGLAPAWQATRNAKPAAGRSRFSLQRVFVAVQVALSLLLLTGATLFLRTLQNLQSVDPGFARENIMLLTVDAGFSGYGEPQRGVLEQILQRVNSLPTVRSAAMADFEPLDNYTGTDFFVEGHSPQANEPSLSPAKATVSAGYFRTMGIRFLLGRDFDSRDRRGAAEVAIVNETFARHYFGTESPIGRRLAHRREGPFEIEIVGVVKDSLDRSLRRAAQRTVYLPMSQLAAGPSMTIHARAAAGSSAALVAAIREEVAQVDRNLPVFDIRTVDDAVEKTLRNERMTAALTSLFGILALVLAAIGLNGLMAYAVRSRTREIGIRMAIGATRGRVLGGVLRDAAWLVAAGIFLAAPAICFCSRLTESFLFGVQPSDPASVLAATAVLLIVALTSAWLPARRASRVDPVTALKYE